MKINFPAYKEQEFSQHFIRNAYRLGWPAIVSGVSLHLLRSLQSYQSQELIFVTLEVLIFITSIGLDWQASKIKWREHRQDFLYFNYALRIILYFSLSVYLALHIYFYEPKSWIGLVVIGVLAGGLESISSSAYSKKKFAFCLLALYGFFPTLLFYLKAQEVYSIPAYIFFFYVLSQIIKINFRYNDLLEMINSKQEAIVNNQYKEELLNKMNYVMSASRFGFFFEDLETNKLTITDELLQITGLPLMENGEEAEKIFRSRIALESREIVSQKIDQFYSGEIEKIELAFRFEKSPNQFIWLSFFMVAEMRDCENRPLRVIGYHQDISIQKDIENKLFQSTKLESIGLMASGMAHEVNNPLTIATLLLTKLLKKELDDQTRSDLKKLELAVNRISKIIKSLKMFSRDDSKDPYEFISLKDLLLESIFFAQPRLENQNIKLTYNIPENLYFRAQKISLSQVFINLIHNASDAIEQLDEKWIHIEGYILTDLNLLRIKIIDSGTGLPKELAEKMMTPFFTTKQAGKGTGLGLSVCLGIIRDHNGLLYIDYDAIHTTFIIDLPLSTQINEQTIL